MVLLISANHVQVNLKFNTSALASFTLSSIIASYFQEVIYAEHGKHPKEALFYSHALPLPGFILLAGNIQEHFAIAAASQPMDLMGFQVLTWVKFLQEIIKLSIRYFPRPPQSTV